MTPGPARDAADGGLRLPDRLYRGYVLDLDGTVYLGDALLPGAGQTLAALRRHARVVYMTNKPLELPADYAAKLTKLGVPTTEHDVVSSTDALLLYLAEHAPGARVFCVAEPVVTNLLIERGYRHTETAGEIDVVVVSFDRTFDYRKLQIAFDAVRAGARIVATNIDPYCPVPGGGGLPDAAAMLAAVEACTGARAEAVVGKPSAHMAATALARLGIPPADAMLVGDRLLTDMRMAREGGMASALVLTGATTLEQVRAAAEQPDYVIDGLDRLLPPATPLPDSQDHGALEATR